MFAQGWNGHHIKDIILVGSVIDQSGIKFIGVSKSRCVKCILNNDLFNNNVLNVDKYKEIPVYSPNKTLNGNYLFYIAKYGDCHIFSNGLGELVALKLDEIETFKKKEIFVFKNCRVSITTDKKRGSISAPDDNICDWQAYFKIGKEKCKWRWDISTPVDGVYIENPQLICTIIHIRLLEAFKNRFDLLEKYGIIDKAHADEYRANILNTIKIGNAIMNLYFKCGVEVVLFGELFHIEYDYYSIINPLNKLLQHSDIYVNTYDVCNYINEKGGYSNISIYPHGGCILIGVVGGYANSKIIEYATLEIHTVGESLRITGYSRPTDQYTPGIRYQIIINRDKTVEYKASFWNYNLYRYGNRKSLENLVELSKNPELNIHKREKFQFNCFVERDAEIRYRQFKFKNDNMNNFELREYSGITAEDYVMLLKRSLVDKSEIKVGRFSKENLYKIEQLNRYEFVKYYSVGDKKDTNKPAYIEVFSNGKIIKTGYIYDMSRYDHLSYDDIDMTPNWQKDLAELNYREYASKKRITVDNRVYSAAYLRNVYENRDDYYTYFQISGLPGYIFGICVRQDILTGIYYLCYRVELDGNDKIQQLVEQAVPTRSRTSGISSKVGYIKICAFKDRECAIEMFVKIKKMLESYMISWMEDHDTLMIDFKKFISNDLYVDAEELKNKALTVNRTYILTRLYYCVLQRSGAEKLLASLFGNDLGIIGD